MNEITIQVHADRKLSKKVVDIGNMQESGVTKLIFELDEDIVALGGNVYLITSYDGESHPHVLKDNSLEVDRSFTQRKKTETNIVVSTSKDTENPLDGVVWISNTLMLTVDKNSINIESINEEELPPSLKIIYDDLLNLQKDLQEKKDNDYWRGPQGAKGDAGSVKFVVVKELPTENIEENVMYLVQVESEEENNKFLEYIYVDGSWENVGSASVEVDLTDYVKNTDYATSSNCGVIKAMTGYGAYTNNAGVLVIQKSSEKEIDERTNKFKPIVPEMLDYAVMKSLSDSKLEWTDEQKELARELIGVPKIKNYSSGLVSADGYLMITQATKSNINDKTITTKPITPQNIDYAVKKALSDCKLEGDDVWTEEEKASARGVLGASSDILNSAGGEVVTTTDSAKVKPKNIKLFGKSKQDGTPSMETPIVPVHHGESGSIGGKVLTGNLFELTEDMMWKCVLLDTQTGSVRLNYDVGGYYATLIYRKSLLRDLILNNQGKPFTFACDSLPSTHRLSVVINGDRKNGATYYEARTPQGDGNNILSFTVTDFNSIDSIDFRIGTFEGDTSDTTTIINGLRFHIGNNEMSFSPYTEQPFTFQTPNGLRGIPLGQTIPDAIKNSPIHMNGVYWDSVEQQYYIADTKDENGKDVQRIGEYVVTGDEDYADFISSDDYCVFQLRNMYVANNCMLSTHGGSFMANSSYAGFLVVEHFGVTSLAEFRTLARGLYNSDTPLTLYYALEEPIVTETDARYDVVMNYPNTTVVNDEGAYMEVEYVADTKKHIEQNYVAKSELEDIKSQMAEIQQVITNL